MPSQGSRIKAIRQSMHLSQEQFGEKIKVSKQYVSNLEADRNLLNNEKLVSLLVDYNVNINYILAGVGEMFITSDTPKDELKSTIIEVLKDLGKL